MAANSTANSGRPKKLQRISQACDLCHRRSIRCRPSTENPHSQCQNCYDFAIECTYNRPSRRRRHRSNPNNSPRNVLRGQHTSPSHSNAPGDISSSASAVQHEIVEVAEYSAMHDSGVYNIRLGSIGDDAPDVAWQSFALASLQAVDDLLEVYMDAIYPLFPLFHGPTLLHRVEQKHHLRDRGFFASVMAACAFAAARARDGASLHGSNLGVHTDLRLLTSSEVYFNAAADALRKDLSKAKGLSFLRACGLLALTAIQNGQIEAMHQYLGFYMTLSAMQNFHDETAWPNSLGNIEKEERRRLFWSMYTLDIYSGAVFHALLKSQEMRSNVGYPREVDDEDIEKDSTALTQGRKANWLQGWNFTTDLYRLLEHTIQSARCGTEPRVDRVSLSGLAFRDFVSEQEVLYGVENLYRELPAHFRQYGKPMMGEKQQDRIVLQAANIQITLGLVRMVTLGVSSPPDAHAKCSMAEQALSTLYSIAPGHLRTISVPLVYYLKEMRRTLASIVDDPLTEQSYRRLREVLVRMTDMVHGLESGFQLMTGESEEWKDRIRLLDESMRAQRRSYRRSQSDEGKGAQHPSELFRPEASGIDNNTTAPHRTSIGDVLEHAGPELPIPHLHRGSIEAQMSELQFTQDQVGSWAYPSDLSHQSRFNGLSDFLQYPH